MIKDIWNVPNVISLIRLALIPVFIWLVIDANYGPAAILLGIIGATDWIDGYFARRLNQVTELGKFLDPLADRIAVAVAVVAGLLTGVLPFWFAVLLIVRELVIGVGALIGWRNGVQKLEVRYLGKVATLLLYFSVSFFYGYAGFDLEIFWWAAWGTGIPGLIAYYWVAFQYLGDMRTAIANAK